MPAEDLVSVVIPAYNAETTLGETLASVRAQTHAALDIIIVDDGSRDGTAELAAAHAAADPRIRLIRQSNGGVARARNRGVEEARGALIAPVDADDLWAPDKIEKQLAVLRRAGSRTGLVYTWSAVIDAKNHLLSLGYRPTEEGDVLRRLFRGNLLGNGSCALMRREALVGAGGYDPRLRDLKAQGCEDLLLYFRIAERWDFAVAPEHLTGYRETHGTMSGDAAQMIRSWRIVADEMLERHPDAAADLRTGEQRLLIWLLERAIRSRSRRNATVAVRALMRCGPLGAIRETHRPVGRAVRLVGRGALGHWRRITGATPPPRRRFPIGQSDRG